MSLDPKNEHFEGRLRARPTGPDEPSSPVPAGTRSSGLKAADDGALLRLPEGYSAGSPAPLGLLLHGASGRAEDALGLLAHEADAAGVILLAVSSRSYTWDVLVGGYGPDVASIDRALESTFSRYAVDPARVVIGGFSDGASYALSLGLTNGDLFTHVIAFSPGFAAPARHEGSPGIFVSHGTRDRVLPINRCSRRIAPHLDRLGYEVTYREFDGGHVVPPTIAHEAAAWFASQTG
jgi:predicted esterase